MKNSVAYPQLLKCRLFADLCHDDKAELLDRCTARTYELPETVLKQGELSPGIFFIAHGRMDVIVHGDGGEQTLLAHLGPGDTAGEIECISQEPCIASCRTQPLATLLLCPQPVVADYLRVPLFIRNVASVFRGRLEQDNAMKALDQHGSLEQRLFLRLRTLCDGRDRVRANQAHLAEILGCSRQSINKAIGRLRTAGIIEVAKGEVRLLQSDPALEELADTPRLGTVAQSG
ncbi:hypothetical protein GCM10011415_04120 [Salipiger pallidus]|uniref:cAMP-binding domain of CRP or a regulatory subunit of cAMP-dependent protein kinases n=1 Tax=Salipiger pallidus TaxID=1775170 RepID=A0A8J2ZGH4_9RHOB|nr:Crp/Fnr family transcriptional regulator [Salipiger pallidus]GGG61232.1 hypothetical protein GCM10011415_04120 [Salipiger pallidus]